jgi:hypothetical protein|tara:strand:- start:1619 stop:2575 length:957 start_codon:yes stop_codon:yes gene_type:complete
MIAIPRLSKPRVSGAATQPSIPHTASLSATRRRSIARRLRKQESFPRHRVMYAARAPARVVLASHPRHVTKRCVVRTRVCARVSRSNASDDAVRALEIDRRRAMFAVTALMTLSGAAPRAKAEAIVNPQPIDEGWLRFYGEATSSSSYGGYGGNENNFDKFKYYYDVPQGWEQDTVNKVEKSTNGTDNRWKSKKNKDAKVYSITLAGYGKLKEDREAIISDLALSDYNLQDAIIGADSFVTKDRDVDGQTYVDYDLVGFYGNIFASITVYGGRLYSVFAFVPEGESVEAGRRMRDSFATINNKTEQETAADMAFYRRS